MRTRSPFALAALLLLACKAHDKPQWAAPTQADDPWASAAAGGASGDAPGSASPSMPGLGDPLAMIKNVVENLKRPGPYDAPDASPGYAADQPHLGVMVLAGSFGELKSYSWTGSDDVIPLLPFTERLARLADDATLTGLVLRVDGVGASLPDLAELRAAIGAWRAKGKKLYCHTEGAATASYLVLAACDRIALAPTGDVMLMGPSAMPVHLKGLLDRIGVTADFLHVGAYKGAAEPLTRDRPSKEMEEVLGAILDQRYQTMVAMVSESRPALSPDAVRERIDEGLFPAERALAAGLVDEVTPFEAFRDGLGQPWTRIGVEAKDDDTAAMVKLARFIGAVPADRSTTDHVALVYALGDVVDGGGDGIMGARQQIASRTLVPTLRVLAADDHVKAVVIRIDSGGGSALASELIWHAVAEIKAKKPVVVSMSDVAASGGYYIAAGATKIFAQPDTLTGSIGVVGGKLAPGPALAKLGVTTYPMGRGKRATMFASLDPWTADEKVAVQAMMDATYRVFVGRVAAGRNKTPAEIEPIAQGRVWTGAQARQLGLVDELGGLAAAVAAARDLGQVGAGVELEVYPPELALRDLIGRIGDVDVGHLGASVGTAALLDATSQLSPEVAAVVGATLRQVARFRDERVQALALLPIVFR
ncbi:MAG: signal peptide peptidase SppA [Myxococcales bacterium]|nr:signal peptide peptidase SppA [Myxococcales bacterium]